MITQELIDYVKTQLASGITREKVTSDLLGQGGWTTEQINEAFQKASSSQEVISAPLLDVTNKKIDVWGRIKKFNKYTFIIALVLFFVSVVFVIESRLVTGLWELFNNLDDGFNGGLGLYAWMMLGIIALFSFFVWLENTYLSEKYIGTTSKLDKSIEGIIRIRNFIFILNVIPYIQILGLMALMFTGWLILIIYVVLLVRRNKSVTPIV